MIRLAVCPANSGFPDCDEHAIRTATISLKSGEASVGLVGVPTGTYAIGVFHDANENGKLDTFLGIPREGFGFSRNPPLKPRAPHFDEAAIDVQSQQRLEIRLKYIL